MKERNKILGCLFGGAIGDAFGGPYEGHTSPVKVIEDCKWRLSDDTQLTLATCEAITECNGEIKPAVIAAHFASWHKESRFSGVGASTYKALSELVQGGHWALVGSKGERAAGNGAAMRVAPLAFCLNPNDLKARQIIRDVSRITHHNEEAYAGALAVVAAVRAAWDGIWNGQPDLLDLIIDLLPDSRVRDRLTDLARLEKALPLSEISKRFGCSGYVADSVPLALYGAQQVTSLGFKTLLHELVVGGGDTDTIASMAGQVAGTLIGFRALPQEMMARLPELKVCERIAGQFAEVVVNP